jgi:hypothetical protein
LRAQSSFTARHLACIRFVIEAREVKQAVEDQDSDFDGKGVALLGSLSARGRHADGEIADNFFAPFSLVPFLVLEEFSGGEREDVGGLVEAAELAVEAANRLIGCEEN